MHTCAHVCTQYACRDTLRVPIHIILHKIHIIIYTFLNHHIVTCFHDNTHYYAPKLTGEKRETLTTGAMPEIYVLEGEEVIKNQMKRWPSHLTVFRMCTWDRDK